MRYKKTRSVTSLPLCETMVRENSKKENNDRKKEDEKEKIPDGPEKNAKADFALKEGAVEEREGKKVAFMLKEKPVEPKKKQAVLFVIYFAIVVGLASIVIEGTMTKNKSIKEHLGRVRGRADMGW